MAVSFPKFGHPAFAWIALAPLIVGVALSQSVPARGGRPRRDFVLGLVAGAVYFTGTLYWVTGVMTTYGGLNAVLSVVVAGLLICYQALYPAVFSLVLGVALRRFGPSAIWLAPWIWVATEWARSTLFSGFPWVLLGSSQAPVLPVAQAASLVGVFGLSGLVALVATAAADLAISRRTSHRVGAAGVALLLVVTVAAGTFRVVDGRLTRTGSVLRVGLVQGGVEQELKWDPAYRDIILARHLSLSRQVIGRGVGLVIWPESSTPFFFDAEAQYAEPVRRLAAESRTPFLIGTDEFERGVDGAPNRIYNTALLVGPDGESRQAYRKIRLVPFGEFVPLKNLLFFVGPLVEAVSDFSAGTEPVVFDADGRRFSVAICYESVYPDLAQAFVDGGSQLLVTITNDAWFGRSSAAYQHFDLGALRAIEQGRYVVRAANTGISGVVDPYGRVVRESALFETAVLVDEVRLRTAL
ncbi:MAG TPA: apolipoprotein N-acyltransferase, partial [Vicinamibacterales bacterium]|nr:apolipoprotein N-acyltransferase [Vicinamibacterales bacterium]